MKRRILLTLCVLVAVALVACGGPPAVDTEEAPPAGVTEEAPPAEVTEEEEEEVPPADVTEEAPAERPTLEVWLQVTWTDAGDEFLKSEVLQYAEEHGFDVDLFQEDTPVNDPKLQAGMETGVLPDIGYMWQDMPIRMVQAGRLLDVSAEFAEMNKEGGGVVDGAKSAATIDGKQYVLPFNSFSEVLVIRDDLVQAAGLTYPEQFTFSELLEWAKALNVPGEVYGWGQILGEPAESAKQELNGYLLGFGGSVYSPDGETVTINSPETIEFLKFMKEAWDAGVIPLDSPSWGDSGDNQLYMAGGAAIINNGPSVVLAMRDSDPDLLEKTVVMMPPVGPAADRPFDVLGGGFMGVFSTTEYPELAKGLALHLCSYEVNKQMAEISGLMQPVYKEVAGEWSQNPKLAPYMDMLSYNVGPGYPGPDTLWAWEAYNSDVVKNMIVRVLVDGMSPEESAEIAAEEAQDIYDSYH